jgi:hypothetical protein
MTIERMDVPITNTIPLIDSQITAEIETATFALG